MESSATFPDIYSSPGTYEANNSSAGTAGVDPTQSHFIDLEEQRSGNQATGSEDSLNDGSGSKRSDSRGSVGGFGEFEDARVEEESQDSNRPNCSQVQLATGGISDKQASSQSGPMDDRLEKNEGSISDLEQRDRVKSTNSQSDGKSHSQFEKAALGSEEDLTMEAIDVKDLRIIQCDLRESDSLVQPPSLEQSYHTPPGHVISAEFNQPTFSEDNFSLKDRNAAVEDITSVCRVVLDDLVNRTVCLLAQDRNCEAGNTFCEDSKERELLCRDILKELIEEVATGEESRNIVHNFSTAVTRSSQDASLFEAGAESNTEGFPGTCVRFNGKSISSENSSPSSSGQSYGVAACACGCTESRKDFSGGFTELGTSDEGVRKSNGSNKVLTVCGSYATRNRNVSFEKNVEKVFCITENGVVEPHHENEKREEGSLLEGTCLYFDGQIDSTSGLETHMQSIETDSGVCLYNNQTEETGGITSRVLDLETGESDVIAAASDSGCTSRSSVSRDEGPLEEEEGKEDVNQVRS